MKALQSKFDEHTMVPPTARAIMINDDHTAWNPSANDRLDTVQNVITVRSSVAARIVYLLKTNRMIIIYV
jgi:hypothetical protein